MAAMAAAPQMDTPVATSSDVPGGNPRRRPISGVSANVSPVAVTTTATVGQPSASTCGTAICRPSSTIAVRSTRRATNASPGRSRGPAPPRFARSAPAATATTAGLSAGTRRLTTRANATASAVVARPGRSMPPVFAAPGGAGSHRLPVRS